MKQNEFANCAALGAVLSTILIANICSSAEIEIVLNLFLIF